MVQYNTQAEAFSEPRSRGKKKLKEINRHLTIIDHSSTEKKKKKNDSFRKLWQHRWPNTSQAHNLHFIPPPSHRLRFVGPGGPYLWYLRRQAKAWSFFSNVTRALCFVVDIFSCCNRNKPNIENTATYTPASERSFDGRGGGWIVNNCSPKWRWIAVDIYRAASAR